MYQIIPIEAFKDNYIWVIRGNAAHAAVVDPGDAAPVIEFLEANNLILNAILLTHHHPDHVGGVPGLLEYMEVPVFGPSDSDIMSITVPVREGATINLPPQDLQLNVWEIPAHTLDHVAYFNDEILFSGDTLFTAGCGRVFEGSSEQMLNALQRLAGLKPTTKVYCGHEYTLHNLKFAHAVEPENKAVAARLKQVEQMRHDKLPTVPATMAEELTTNPFLRTTAPAIIAAVEKQYGQMFNSQVEIFAALREWKNNFYA